MTSTSGTLTKLAIVPLPKGSILLPGVTLRIPVANRPDLTKLLSSLLDRSVALKRDGTPITFGCIPLSSPLLSNDGQQLLDDGSLDEERREIYETLEAGQARKEDLFRYGTLAKVVGIQRRAYAEPHLIVQGLQRFSVRKFVKERPFFEAEVVLHDDTGMARSACRFDVPS